MDQLLFNTVKCTGCLQALPSFPPFLASYDTKPTNAELYMLRNLFGPTDDKGIYLKIFVMRGREISCAIHAKTRSGFSKSFG